MEVPSDEDQWRGFIGSFACSNSRTVAGWPHGRVPATGTDGLTKSGFGRWTTRASATTGFGGYNVSVLVARWPSVAFYARAALRRIDFGGERSHNLSGPANLAGATWEYRRRQHCFRPLPQVRPIMRVSADGASRLQLWTSSGVPRRDPQLSPFLLPDSDPSVLGWNPPPTIFRSQRPVRWLDVASRPKSSSRSARTQFTRDISSFWMVRPKVAAV